MKKIHQELNLIPYEGLVEEIDREIEFYENSDHSHDFEKWSNTGAVGALQSLKENIAKLIVR